MVNKRRIYLLLVIGSIVTFLHGCEIDSDKYSVVPYVEFIDSKDTVSYDILGNLNKQVDVEFYLIDGDGDVGLYEGIGYPYIGDSSCNYFSDCYYIENGITNINPLLVDSVKNYIIPFIDIVGLDKTVKANVFISYQFSVGLFPFDSILFSFYVVDRAFNKSNVAWTDTIVFPKQ